MSEIVFHGVSFTTYTLKPEATSILPPIIPGKTPHFYGNGPFCQFSPLSQVIGKRGLYVFVVDDKVHYLGRCLDDYGIRMREYGHITSSDCYNNGRPTNCHVNQELNNAFTADKKVAFGIYPMVDDDESIKTAEKTLLKKMKSSPQTYWNLSY